jgi:stearoyl-CoA desaturase (delta-9 desaturase)
LRLWFQTDESALAESDRARLASTLEQCAALNTVYAMGRDLAALWERSTESREELLARLQDWCHRAEASNIVALQRFSRRLRSYT